MSLGGVAMWDVAVGSENPAKVSAVRTVFWRLGLREVTALAVSSGVRAQPLGLEETRSGAEHRAHAALGHTGACYGVGLEAGVDLADGESVFLLNVAVVLDRAGRRHWALGPQLLLPPSAAAAVREGEELASVIDRLSGMQDLRSGIGAIGWLTGGVVSREQCWAVTLACAIAPLLHPGLYDVPST